MPTYLLTWNPERWPWKDLRAEATAVRQGRQRPRRWTTGVTRRIRPGDRVFYLKQGKQPRGIFASGRATSGVERKEHWDEERRRQGIRANSVELVFDVLLVPGRDLILDWKPQASGIHIPDTAAKELEALWAAHLRAIGWASSTPRVAEREEPYGPTAFDRISFDPKILGGRACIRGLRIPVSLVVSQLAHGASRAEILKDYPDLELEDLQQALEYAAWLTHEEIHPAIR